MVLNVKRMVFWDVISCGLVKGTSVVEEPAASIFSESSAVHMETGNFSERLLRIYQTACHHILEDCGIMRQSVYYCLYVSSHVLSPAIFK
jgi:hypothetical protein|uniref:Uncharacterized protein n=1 Tax=Coptotermes formosanus TaxID=36987 RepID=R4V0G0_COPFO|nr:hypothetical protein [Coptotermes formosanus]